MHVGHRVVAEVAGETLGMGVRVVPAREQPFKRAAHVASPEQRAAIEADNVRRGLV